MHVSADFVSESDLLDRVIDKGIVIEAWDRLRLPAIDLTGMRVTISLLELFTQGRAPFRGGLFRKVKL